MLTPHKCLTVVKGIQEGHSDILIEYVEYSHSNLLEPLCLQENKAETRDGHFSDGIIIKHCHKGTEEKVFKKSRGSGLEHANFRTSQGVD